MTEQICNNNLDKAIYTHYKMQMAEILHNIKNLRQSAIINKTYNIGVERENK